jgi:hypothetical protein
VCIINAHLSISPKNISYLFFTIQLQSILERWVLKYLALKILNES